MRYGLSTKEFTGPLVDVYEPWPPPLYSIVPGVNHTMDQSLTLIDARIQFLV